MQEYHTGLKKIKTRAENLYLWNMKCLVLFVFTGLISIAVKPMAIIASLVLYFWLLLYFRLLLSDCPKCNKKFFSLWQIMFSIRFYRSASTSGLQCNHCKLSMNVLPESN